MQSPPVSRRPGLIAVLVTALIPLAFTVAGAFLLIHAWPPLIEGLSAQSWPDTSGRVIETRVVEVHLESQGPGTKRWFEVRVTYTFDAAGRTHRGDRTGLWPERRLGQQARALAAGYPPGQPVSVYYNPSDPARSMLDRSIGGGTWAMAIAGVPLFALGVAMCIGFVRGVRRG